MGPGFDSTTISGDLTLFNLINLEMQRLHGHLYSVKEVYSHDRPEKPGICNEWAKSQLEKFHQSLLDAVEMQAGEDYE